jgi:uncharacterized membrane protein YobD (UPF0266 family)
MAKFTKTKRGSYVLHVPKEFLDAMEADEDSILNLQMHNKRLCITVIGRKSREEQKNESG